MEQTEGSQGGTHRLQEEELNLRTQHELEETKMHELHSQQEETLRKQHQEEERNEQLQHEQEEKELRLQHEIEEETLRKKLEDEERSKADEFSIQIDRVHFKVSQIEMTGAEIRKVPPTPIGADRDLFEVVPGHPDRKIGDSDIVAISNGKRFFTAPGHINPGMAL